MMKFKFKNVLVRGEKHIKIMEFTGILPHKKLPVEYTSGYPFMKDDEDGEVSIYCSQNEWTRICVGREINMGEFAETFKTIKAAGKRLSEINKKIKEKNKSWEGKEWEVKI